ncbi:hypothetical protein [Candidatus Aalborgicola defluviihabitans]|uniref:hypothetical protein n=1 Tax=Candidatus Aalborgicola defluviihabitans TaxID=3386187 RepID=UPI0039B8B33B
MPKRPCTASRNAGRNSVRQFVPEMGSAAISRLDMEAAMRRGLERGEFLLHY